jgi:hypothetical protein
MNIQPAHQVPADITRSDQWLCLCHDTPDCPEQAIVQINANRSRASPSYSTCWTGPYAWPTSSATIWPTTFTRPRACPLGQRLGGRVIHLPLVVWTSSGLD